MKNQETQEQKLFEGNREDWLNKVADFTYEKVKAEFVPAVPRENIKLSIGFMPKGSQSAIGVCHYEGSSAGNYREIFISPELGAGNLIDCIETAQVVAHEVVHAMLPKGAGHGHKFAKVMKYLGATGKPTATVAGPKFTMDYQPFIEKLGMLPHSRMKSPAPKTGGTTAAIRCIDTDCVGASDKSIAQGWGLIARLSIATIKKVGENNLRCMACGGSTYVEMPDKVRTDYS